MLQIGDIVDTQLDEVDYFVVWATELYRANKGLSGSEINELFAKHNIYEMLRENYFLYHIESSENFIAEIDKVIKHAF